MKNFKEKYFFCLKDEKTARKKQKLSNKKARRNTSVIYIYIYIYIYIKDIYIYIEREREREMSSQREVSKFET